MTTVTRHGVRHGHTRSSDMRSMVCFFLRTLKPPNHALPGAVQGHRGRTLQHASQQNKGEGARAQSDPTSVAIGGDDW